MDTEFDDSGKRELGEGRGGEREGEKRNFFFFFKRFFIRISGKLF